MDLSRFALLKTKHLSCETPFVHTRQEWKPILLDDPAISALTDFTVQPVCTTNESSNIQAALQQMKLSRVKSLFVVNAKDLILGHISARDIQGTKPAKIADQLGIKPAEVTVKMLMVSCDAMMTLHFNELSNARVGHIVRLLHERGSNYIFVVEGPPENEFVRGIFSISRISHQLGENVTSEGSSHSVAEMTHLI